MPMYWSAKSSQSPQRSAAQRGLGVLEHRGEHVAVAVGPGRRVAEEGFGERVPGQQVEVGLIFLGNGGSPIISVLAHPGLTSTNLTPRAWEHRGRFGRILARSFLVVTQPVERGVLPQLYATTASAVRGGQFFGPSGFRELRGDAVEVQPSAEARDPAVGRQLWSAAESLTGVTYL